MKICRTVFDREWQREDTDMSSQGGDKLAPEGEMLLRTHNTEVFEPREDELAAMTSDELDTVMDKTEKARRHSIERRRNFRPWKILSCAASLVLVCALAVFLMREQKTTPPPTEPSDNPLEIGSFRGGIKTENGEAEVPEAEQDLEPLAYLVDTQGGITIRRGSRTLHATGSCEVLYAGDVVVLLQGEKAKIMYEDSFFDMIGPGEFEIASPSPLKMAANNMRQVIEPTFTTRGAGQAQTTAKIALPPKMLLAQVVPPVTRAGENHINVYSPKGASFTREPVIHIGGEEKATYTVEIFDITGEQVGKSVQMKGNSTMGWSAIVTTPLEEDEIYSLKVTLDGKIVNNFANANFWLLSSEDRKQVDDNLKMLQKIDDQEARDFFKANALYMAGCYAEAKGIAEKKSMTGQQKMICLHFSKMCNNALGIK